MSERIASAVFDSREDAQRAIEALRAAGVREQAISVVGQQGEMASDGDSVGSGSDDDGANKSGALKGALTGAGIGGLLGIAALAIPGVGPLAAAGAIAASAVPEAAAIGAGVGALGGGLSGLLTKHGVSDEDAGYYEEHINRGGIFVSVDTDDAGVDGQTARDILYRSGGHSASRQRESTI